MLLGGRGMAEIEGRIIHKAKDRYCDLTVAESGGKRTLYFGGDTVQSSMYLHQPTTLAMEYSQAMMSILLFNRHPSRVLLFGLGGGSLVKFFLDVCPNTEIDVVEISSKVIETAREYFYLPVEIHGHG